MSVGDLIDAATRFPCYEFNGVLYGMSETTGILVETTDGFEDLPDVKIKDLDRVDAHGSSPYPHLMNSRKFAMKGHVLNDWGSDVEAVVRSIQAATQPQNVETQLVFKRPGYTDKRYANARCSRRQTTSSYDRAKGHAGFALEWIATDPHIYDFTQNSVTQKIVDGSHAETVTVTPGGNTETQPIFLITGPCTNPRLGISSQVPMADGTRYDTRATTVGGTPYAYAVIALDIALVAGDTLLIDRTQKTVVFTPFSTGVPANAYGNVRSDNRWWQLLPGANTISFTESGSAGVGSTLNIKWNNAYA